MHSVVVWWGHMAVFSQVFWGIALFGSVVLAMQIISMFLGLEGIGGHDADATIDSHDSGHGHSSGHSSHGFMAGLKLLTLRNMVAFVCMFGWTGLVMIEYGAGKFLTCTVAFWIGCFSMFLMAVFMRIVYSMAVSGNIDEDAFVGKQAIVYIPIPASGTGIGKINLSMDGKLEERTAKTIGPGLPVGATVKILSHSNNIFMVTASTNN